MNLYEKLKRENRISDEIGDLLAEAFIEESISLMEDIEGILKYYPGVTLEQANEIVAIDPTAKVEKGFAGSYGKWLLSMFSKGEDVLGKKAELTTALNTFETLKKRKELEKTDINQYRSLDDLLSITAGREEEASTATALLAARDIESRGGCRVVLVSDKGMIVRPLSYEGAKEVSHIGYNGDYGTEQYGTAWCTAGGRTGRGYGDTGEHWRGYQRNGQVYLDFIPFSNSGDGKFQGNFHANGSVDQFLDAADNPTKSVVSVIISMNLVEKLREVNGIVEGVNLSQYVTQATEAEKLMGNGTYMFDGTPLRDAARQTGLDEGTFKSLIKVITVADSVTELPKECFKECSSLKAILIPDTVKRLGAFCFQNCTSLNRVEGMNNVEGIPAGCFSGCGKLKSIKLTPSMSLNAHPEIINELRDADQTRKAEILSVAVNSSGYGIKAAAFDGVDANFKLYWPTDPSTGKALLIPTVRIITPWAKEHKVNY